MSRGGFKESLLVPTTFLKTTETKSRAKNQQKKSTNFSKNNPLSILSDESTPADIRLKYFDNFIRHNPVRAKPPIKVITKSEEEYQSQHISQIDINNILQDIPSDKKPLASSILNFIKDSNEIQWNNRHEIILDGNIIPGSNIKSIIQFLVGEVVYTNDRIDTPVGLSEVKKKLIVLGLSPSWLRKAPRQSERTQKGKGANWLVY
jgi:hypothetical protein